VLAVDNVRLEIARSGAGWSIKHNGGFLGHVRTHAEAVRLASMLAEEVHFPGARSGEVVCELRSFAGQ
jgi:hypothetical protein